MIKTILAASALTLGLATSAMAQYATGTTDTTVVTDPAPANDGWWGGGMWVDRNTTGSINGGPDVYGNTGLSSMGNNGAIGPCASNGPGPDANSSLNVNDQYCGK
jgi:hypothetical protein